MRDTNSMVEEFMLAANISSAQRIFEEFPDCAMLRRHPAPPPSNFDPLVKAGRQQGFEILVDSGKNVRVRISDFSLSPSPTKWPGPKSSDIFRFQYRYFSILPKRLRILGHLFT
jgi:hypothetical protein